MNIGGMKCFLSEDNIHRHIDYVNTLKLKYSILEKSFPVMRGVDIKEILRLNLPSDAKSEALDLMWQINSHRCFFDSYVIESGKNNIKKSFGISSEKMIYDVYSLAIQEDYGFIYLFIDKKGGLKQHFTSRYDGAFDKYQPLLAIDLYEHTYFSDYGFKKDKFLRNALSYLDLSKLS